MTTSGDEMKLWGQALERLREDRGLSLRDVCYRAGMERPQYRVICYKLVAGPSLDTLDRLLRAMGCTWQDWAEVYDALHAGLASKQEPVVLKPAVNDGPARGVRKPPPSRGAPSKRAAKLNP